MELAFDDEGRGGTPLLLVHGHPFDRTTWRPQVERFSPERRVIVPDLRGYGASPASGPGPVRLEDFAGDLAALLDALEVESVVIGGLSMGGQIVMTFLRMFPQRVRGLVLMATSPAADTPEAADARRATAARLEAEGLDPYAREVLHRMVSPTADPRVAAHVLDVMRRTSPAAAAAAMRGRCERPDLSGVLAGATVPALVVVGTQDEYTPVAEVRGMHALLPDSRLLVVDSAHLPNLERPAEVNEALAAFLSDLDA
ncbi:alpha/beta fold hydrolase [Umezawaea beigongshangensis]|uniref:alpha/beta fold hydrolase n=1 Tax=Umezawaea beigongshangensis TaxID=2780383 RepID=UPI0018F164C6|nr:alpha/beta hydrolase [Umezawaea beigongshangensis]